MKITAIKTFMGLFSGRNRALIKVETDEGIHGWGEAYSIGPDLSIEPIADYIFEMIKGEDPRRIEYIVLNEPYLPKDGYLELRDRPGLGIDVNEDAISEDKYVHWQRTCPVRPDGSSGYI